MSLIAKLSFMRHNVDVSQAFSLLNIVDADVSYTLQSTLLAIGARAGVTAPSKRGSSLQSPVSTSNTVNTQHYFHITAKSL